MRRTEVVEVCQLVAVQAATVDHSEPFSHDGYFICEVANDDGARFTVCIIKTKKE